MLVRPWFDAVEEQEAAEQISGDFQTNPIRMEMKMASTGSPICLILNLYR